jgi:hypothetical protein
MAEFDINKVKGNDRFIAGGAVLLLVLSFFPWYTAKASGASISGVSIGSHSSSTSLWHAYGLNKLALLLAVAAGAVVIARLMGALDNVQLPAGVNLITLGLTALATLLFVVRFLTAFKSETIFTAKVSAHPGFGWYLGILVSAAMTYFAFLNFKASGEEMPTLPQGGSTPPPPPPAQ